MKHEVDPIQNHDVLAKFVNCFRADMLLGCFVRIALTAKNHCALVLNVKYRNLLPDNLKKLTWVQIQVRTHCVHHICVFNAINDGASFEPTVGYANVIKRMISSSHCRDEDFYRPIRSQQIEGISPTNNSSQND